MIVGVLLCRLRLECGKQLASTHTLLISCRVLTYTFIGETFAPLLWHLQNSRLCRCSR
jgi:hypothetical protein